MRSMIETNILAFSNLINENLKYLDVNIPSGRRYFESNEEEKEWIKNLQISDKLLVTPDIRLLHIIFENNSYVIIIGANVSHAAQFDPNIIEEVELNSGLITVLLSENDLKIHKRADHLEFYNNILFQYKDESYKGNDFREILQYLEPIQIFKLPEDSIIKSNVLSKFTCYFFSISKSDLILDFSDSVTEFISELSIMGSDNISYKLIINSIFSTTYKHAFLELYRLVERLFPIIYIKEFHTRSNSQLNFLDFTSELENVTSWRPKEDEAIEKIFIGSKPTIKQHFDNFLNSSVELKDKKDYQFFYKLRNSIVHFRANHLEISLKPEQWNLLLLATLHLIDDHYSVNYDILK